MTANILSKVRTLPGSNVPAKAAIKGAVDAAVRRIAPLWPLDHFVAVNPFLGFSDERFEHAARRVESACRSRLTMPRSFYRGAYASGRLCERDLEQVLARASWAGDLTAEAVIRALLEGGDTTPQAAMPTIADVVAQQTDCDWPSEVVERISHWAAGYFDAGQASWPSPFSALRPFEAWRREAAVDRSDEVLGLKGARKRLDAMPGSPEAFCEYALERLAVHEDALDLYLHRLLFDIGGWVAYARYRSWGEELAGQAPGWVIDLLAIRLAWELLLLESFAHDGAELAWRRAMSSAPRSANLSREGSQEELVTRVLQEAYELAWQRDAIAALQTSKEQRASAEGRPAAQAVFCIDVRSEVLRRALEEVDGKLETLGFAGFFGLPIEYIPLASEGGASHCPVLLEPALSVRESLNNEPAEMSSRLSRRIGLRRQLGRGWRAFKNSAVSCFVFVESYGLAYALKLAAHTLGMARPEPVPAHRGLPRRLARELGPQLSPLDGLGEGVGLDRQISFAESILRGMSLTDNFARIVMLAGHGSSTTNNAHASGLDCGACGGQTGEASARIAAMILNNGEVREALRECDINIPEDTVFLAALHNTTTDEVELFDLDAMPASHAQDIADLEQRLGEAGELARGERSRLLGFAPGTDPLAGVLRKSKDWSEVRPEWGLAGCAGFIAAPRSVTRRLDLGGRCFLHSYDHRQDPDYSILELIMTAPMVVASWISLQYYGSTVDNRAFGSGDKTLHNVVGGSLGVLEGNGGDLRVGLPLQSVHNGREFIHEPLRLSVFLAAPIAAINRILEKHEGVRQLMDNGWLHLFAIYDDGDLVARYCGDYQWDAVSEGSSGNGHEESSD